MSAELAETSAAEERQRTMQVRAVRRLSSCELGGLGRALEQLEVVEAQLVEALPKLRAAATKEANVRQAKGLPVAGPYVRGWSAVRELLVIVGEARHEVTHVGSTGKVVKR